MMVGNRKFGFIKENMISFKDLSRNDQVFADELLFPLS